MEKKMLFSKFGTYVDVLSLHYKNPFSEIVKPKDMGLRGGGA